MAQSVSVAASGQDGRVYKTNSTVYPPDTATSVLLADTTVLVRKNFVAGPNYAIGVGLFRFDTSSIPDGAIIYGATLSLHINSGTSTDSRDLTAEWYDPGTIDAADYTATVGTTAHAGTSLATIIAGAPSTKDLVLLDPAANISKTATTGLRLHISGSTPTGLNEVFVSAWDHATNPQAVLYVEYTEALSFSTALFPKPKLQFPVPVRW